MKRLLIIGGLLITCLLSYSQSKKVSELTEDTQVDTNDWLYSIDVGVTSKKLKMSTVLNAIKDSVTSLQDIMNDSLEIHWAAIAGSGTGSWSKSGDYMYQTSNDDSVGIGINTPLHKLHVVGTSLIDGDLWQTSGDRHYFNTSGTAYITEASDQLYFHDDAVGTVTLNSMFNQYTGDNLIEISGTDIRLGGTATKNTSFNLGSYYWFIYTPAADEFLIQSNNFLADFRDFRLQNDSVYFGYTNSTNQLKVVDNRTIKKGLQSEIFSTDTIIFDFAASGIRNYQNDNDLYFYYPTNNRGFYWAFAPLASALLDMSLPSGLTFHDDYTSVQYNNDYLYWEGSNILRTSTDSFATKDYARSVGGGEVSISGTPADNQIAVWTDASTIEGNSTFTFSDNGDTLIFDNLYKIYRNTTSGHLIFAYQNIPHFAVGNASYWGYVNTNGAMIGNFARSSTLSSYTWEGDNNTGLGSPLDDRLYLQAGGDKPIEITTDSIIANDTIYCKYVISGAKSQPMWAAIDSITGALYGDSLADAGFGRVMEIPETATEFMEDVHNDEWAYYYKNRKGEIIKEYTINGGPYKVIQKLASRIEFDIRYISKLEKKNEELENRVARLEKLISIDYHDPNNQKSIFKFDIDDKLEQSKQEADEILHSY